MSNVLRGLPSVNELLDSPPLKSLARRLSHNVVVSQVGRFLEGMRGQVQSTATALHVPAPAELAQRIADWIASEQQSDVRPVINATGFLLHPELGGAPLAPEAVQAVLVVASGYAAMDFDLASGEVASRTKAIERILIRLTGAEAATVVNSQAGAAVLSLAAVAGGREVIVSRGQLIEVPRSHRVTEIVAASGAGLREVGAANLTRLADYAAACGDRTAAVMHVHTPAGAAPEGDEDPAIAELSDLTRRHKLPLIDVLGDGSIIDLSRYDVHGEAVAGESIRAGADLVLVGGERLLGGPQCGLILGRRALVQSIEKHPLMAALRADRLTIAALAATLHLYQDPELAERQVPLLSLLATPLENLKNRAERLGPQIAASGLALVEVVASKARISSTSRPNRSIPSYALALTPIGGTTPALATALRSGKAPVVGQLDGKRIWLDLRTVLPRQDVELAAAFVDLEAASQALSDRPVASNPE